jgi:ribosomal protein L16 Arg81 hydroxylase
MVSQAPMPAGFAGLIAPIASQDFFQQYWERKPLHVRRGSPGYFERLLTDRELEAIVSSADLRFPAIQLAKNGAYLAPEAYTKNLKHGSESFSGVPDIAQIQSEYRSGATVVLPALQRIWTPLKELCVTLEGEIGHPVHANAYLTPGDAPGFTPHYDTHEVFVLQISGSKRWRIFEPPVKLPHRTQPFSPVGYVLPPPILEVELAQGDLLYLPRGYVHAAHTSRGHSAHVTIGVTVYTWIELLSELIVTSKDMAELRTALPPGFAADARIKDSLKEGLARSIEQLSAGHDADRVVDDFLRRVRSTHARPTPSFRAEETVIGLHTRLKAPDPSRYRIVAENRGIVLDFEGRKFVLPDKIRSVIDEMCSRKSFRPEELTGPLDDDSKLNLVRYLHSEGFIALAN